MDKKLLEKTGFILLFSILITAVISLLNISAMPQDPAYHHFVDDRSLLNIPNFNNVLSNLPFLLVGSLGLYFIIIKQQLRLLTEIRYIYISFFTSLCLLPFGSAYYHLFPDNSTLLWDRLPMSIAFMSLLCIVMSEFISIKLGNLFFIPLVLIGITSVVYWHFTEQAGKGDLRLYVMTQFIPMLLIPVILIFYRGRFSHRNGYWLLLGGYFLAKLCEHFDAEIYTLTQQIISGHTLKHLVAAAAIFMLLKAFYERQRTDD